MRQTKSVAESQGEENWRAVAIGNPGLSVHPHAANRCGNSAHTWRCGQTVIHNRCAGLSASPPIFIVANWLQSCVQTGLTVDGVYWIPLYDILEERGSSLSRQRTAHQELPDGRRCAGSHVAEITHLRVAEQLVQPTSKIRSAHLLAAAVTTRHGSGDLLQRMQESATHETFS